MMNRFLWVPMLVLSCCRVAQRNEVVACVQDSNCPDGYRCDLQIRKCIQGIADGAAQVAGSTMGAAGQVEVSTAGSRSSHMVVAGLMAQTPASDAGAGTAAVAGASGGLASSGSGGTLMSVAGSNGGAQTSRPAVWAKGEVAVATAGMACDRPSLQSCSAHGSAQRLVCESGMWRATTGCPEGQLCDSTSEGKQGACQQAVNACAGKMPQAGACDGVKAIQCGADLVTATELMTCSGSTPVCRDGKCTCKFECSGRCADIASDAENCGGCSHSCEGSTCEQGICKPKVLATAAGRFDQVAVDDSYAYYVEFSDDVTKSWSASSFAKLMRIGLDGSNATELSRDSDDNRPPIRFALDKSAIYWIVGDGSLRKVPLSGGSASTVNGANVSYTLAIAVSNGFAYFNGVGGSIVKLSVDGGSPQQLVASGVRATQMVADAESLYWTDAEAGTVNKVSLGGGAPVILASAQMSAGPIAVNTKNVYWTEKQSSAVRMVPLAGGSWKPVVQSGASSSLALDDSYVYFATSSFVERVPLEGGAPEGLAIGIMNGYELAASNTALFVTTHSNPSQLIKVLKGPPPPTKP